MIQSTRWETVWARTLEPAVLLADALELKLRAAHCCASRHGMSRRSASVISEFMAKPMMPIVIMPVTTCWVCSSIRLC